MNLPTPSRVIYCETAKGLQDVFDGLTGESEPSILVFLYKFIKT